MRQKPPLSRRSAFRAGVTAVAVATALLASAPARAQTATAAAAYERAQDQEREALAALPPSPDTLRKVARAYEAIALRFPVSGYSDNALWQAAELLERAFGLAGVQRDRDLAIKDLAWLQKEYPHSPLVRQAAARVTALTATPAAETPPIRTTSAPSVAPPSSGSESNRAAAGPPVAVKNITQSPLPRGDRITIELSGEASYSGERVTGPDRVFFDFTNTTTSSAGASSFAERIRAIHSPLIKGVRVGVPNKGVTRVVLELAGAPRFSSFPLYDPFRLVVDVESMTEAANTTPAAAASSATSPAASSGPSSTPASPPSSPASAPLVTPAPASAQPSAPAKSTSSTTSPPPSPAPPASNQKGDYSLARQLGLRVARVVIDPGHGGHDPGAMSNGVTEADLVLDVALRLEKLLSQQPGVEVVLTRRTNEFIPLEERTAIANRENADLFLSIHANAHRQTAVRGVETYFLNFAMNDEAEAVAARENATSGQTMGTLPAIVKAIALNNKLAESRELAGLLQTTLVRRLRTQSTGVKDLGVKQAPFVVLIGAQMPSVLTEIAFLTNRPESSLLKQPAYRQQIAQALKDGVVRYQESLKKVTTVAVRERDPGR